MATNGINEILARSRRKRVNEEEESRKKTKTCLLAISVVINTVTSWYHDRFMVREPLQDWDQERRCYLNRLYNGSEVDCIEQLRVSKQAFIKLCSILQEAGGLVRTRHVSVEEAVAIFLHILAHNLKYRVIKFTYYRSKETISRQFNRVLHAVLKVSREFLKLHEWVIDGSDVEKWKWFEVISYTIYIPRKIYF